MFFMEILQPKVKNVLSRANFKPSCPAAVRSLVGKCHYAPRTKTVFISLLVRVLLLIFFSFREFPVKSAQDQPYVCCKVGPPPERSEVLVRNILR